jgi:peptidyl-tRNA hydrolase
LYAIIREDLNMSPGKLSAQAGHAFLDSYLETERINPQRAEEYRSDGHGTKITLNAPS